MNLQQRAVPVPPPAVDPRKAWRILGPVLTFAGAALVAAGAVSFVRSVGRTDPPRYFWCVFAGIPTLALGVSLTFPGAAREAPGDEPSALTGPDAASEGGAPSAAVAGRVCPRCRAPLPEGVHFCRDCLDVPEDAARV